MMIGVTGATGFVGGCICTRLAKDGHRPRATARETSDTSLVEQLAADVCVADMAEVDKMPAFVEGCDCVLHAAVGYAATRAESRRRISR